MATHLPNHLKCVFTEINVGKHRTVRHYEPQQGITSRGIFSDLINVSNNRAFAKSDPEFWVKQRLNGKWTTPAATGLFRTSLDNVYHGDLHFKTHLFLVGFSSDYSTITADLFPNFFTYNIEPIINSLFK